MTSVRRLVSLVVVVTPSVAVGDGFDPLHADGWPKGYSVAQLRHLPACGPDGLPHEPGAEIHCRPRYTTGAPQWGLAADWTTGGTFGDVPTLGGAHGVGVEANLAVLRAVQLGARYELLAIRLAGMTNDTAYASHAFGQLKYRWFTDEVTREAWTLGAGYGWALRPDELGDDGAVARLSLAREVGLDLQSRSTAMTAAVELAYERSLLDARLDAALASIRLGFETRVRPAANLGEPEPDRWHRTTSLDVFAPGGFGMTLGLRATPRLSFETSGSYISDLEDGSLRAFREASWSAQTGVRVQALAWPADFLPLYGQVQGGVAWYAREPEGELVPIQTAELGVRLLCSTRRGSIAFDAGGWVRTHVDDATLEALAAGIVVRIVVGADRTAIGGTGKSCLGGAASSGGTRLTLAQPGGSASSGGGSGGTTTTVTLQPPDLPDVRIGGNVTTTVTPTSPPPPPPAEASGPPRPGFVWIAGHWEWRGSWTWIAGHWARARAGATWIPGRWELVGGVYVWTAGRWTPAAPTVRDHRR